MRKDFDREYIEKELTRLDKDLDERIDFYMLGGGAMSFRGLKAATKDVDGVVKSRKEFDRLKRALADSRYDEIEVSEVYEKMKTRIFLQNEEGFRFDLFVKKIADGLLLSDGMMNRSERLLGLEDLNVLVMSPEDIFILKSVTSRERDKDDMNILFTQGLDFDVIKEEIIWQSENSTSKAWLAYFYVGLVEFVEKYGFEIPYFDEFGEIASREVVRYQIKDMLRDGEMKITEIVDEIGEDREWVEDVLKEMEGDEISIKGDIVRKL